MSSPWNDVANGDTHIPIDAPITDITKQSTGDDKLSVEDYVGGRDSSRTV